MKKFILPILFFISAFAFSQTTVTLEDQCNCEVLSGTEVTAAGSTAPAGADLGDLYLNTNTGTIYFWDGDSWELTSGKPSTVIDNGDGTYTLTDDSGNSVTINTNSTDDQALTLAAGNILTLEDGGTVDLTPFLDNTDDQSITTFSLDNTTNVLTLTLEDGGTQTVDFTTVLAAAGTDDQTATEVSVTDTAGNFTATDVEGALAELATGSTDDQALTLAAGNILTLEDGGTVDLTPFLDNTDNQSITTFSLDNTTNVLTLTLEDGGTQTVDFTTVLAAAGTDDQTATEVSYVNTTSGLTATDTQAAIDELKADVDAFAATSGQTNTGSNVGVGGVGVFARKTGADLEFKNINAGSNKISITNDGGNDEIDIDINEANIIITESQISDLTHTVNTDDQTATEVSVTDTAGNFTATDVEGALAELATGSTDDQALTLAAGNILTLEDGGTVDLTPFLDNTDDQSITTFSLDNTTNVLTLTLEDGGTQTVDFTTVLAAAGTDDQTATEVSVTDTAGNFTATDVEGALAELATGSTDDQALTLAAGNILTLEDGGTVDLTPFLDNTDDQSITTFSLDNTTNVLTLTLEDGGTQTVDFTTVLAAAGTDDQTATEVSVTDTAGNFTATDVEGALAELATGSTDDQALTLAAGNILTLEDGGTVDLTPFLDNTDDQSITTFSLDNTTNVLTLTLEDGGTQTVDFTTVLAAAGTDDQTATEVSVTDTAGNFTATDVEGALAELATGSTDDQALTLAAGNILTLEDGGTVDLTPFLDNTDDQSITTFSLDNTTNVLTLTLEDGGTQTVDFTTVLAAAGTDDQTATEVSYVNTTSGLTATDTQAAIDELKADVDAFAATSGQTNTGSNVGVGGVGVFARKTGADLEFKNINAGSNKISITNDGGNDEIDIDINEANIIITESQISDLTHTVNTDDQTATEVSVTDTAGNFTATDVEGALAELATGSTDDQALTLAAGNILTLEDGGTVDLTPFLDNTDDQSITTFSLDNTTNVLTLTLEDGGTQTVDFTTVLAAAGTDDQTATEVSVTDTAGNFTATDVEGALAELATGSTDDQALTLAAGNILTLEDGGTVDLTPFLDNTDNQSITTFSLDNTTNVLTLTLEDGGTQTVDFTTVLAAAGTDDQTATEVSVTDTAGNFTATDVEGALAELATGSTDDQALTLAAGNILTLEDGGTVDLTPFLDNTDDQSITTFSLDNTTNVLTLTLEDGGTQTVDFTTVLAAAGTDDQTATEVSVTDTAGNFTATDVEGALAELATGSTDDQALTLAAGNILTLEDGGTVDLTPFLDNTDDQSITTFSLDNTTNVLTLTLEDGGTQTVDFTTVLAAAGTDDQTATEVSYVNTTSGLTATDTQAAIDELKADVDAFAATSGQTNTGSNVGVGGVGVFARKTGADLEFKNINAGSNKISITNDGGNDEIDIDINEANIIITESQISDLTHTVNTDDQTATEVSVTDTAGNFTATDVEGALAELATGSTDDQALTLAAGNILTLEDGGTVDLTPFLDNTDDQSITTFSLDNTTNVLTLTLEDGGTQTVDFTTVLAAAGTDDQTATEVSVTDTAGNFTATDVEGALAELATGSTDDQALTLAAGNILTLEDGGTVDLTPFLDNTDDQSITTFSLDNTTNVLTLTLEDGGTQTVDFTTVLAAAGTDDQTATEVSYVNTTSGLTATDTQAAIDELKADVDAFAATSGQTNTGSNVGVGGVGVFARKTGADLEFKNINAGSNKISITNDGGNDEIDIDINEANIIITESQISDLTHTVNTDDQTATEVSVTDTAGNFTATDVEGALAELATGSTDDQALTLAAGNILTLEDGGTVDLTPFLDNTDDQSITTFSLDNTTNVLTLTLEDGGTQTVDFTTVLAAAGTDDQTATEVSVTDTAGNFTATDVEGALAELATGSTDDQALTLAAGNILTLEDGGTVDLTPFLDNTDNQSITTFSLDNTTNVLTLTLEDGGTQTVDFTTVLAAAGTDDQTATEVSYVNTTSGLTATDTQAAIDELKADVDAFAATSGQTNTGSNVGVGGVGVFARKTGADLEFKNINAGSNKISITNDGGNDEIDIDINEANIIITESQISDLTHTVNTDDQTATEVSVTDTAGNFTATDVEGALAELATGSTDDQALTLAAGNILTLEDGGTVDLTPFLDNTDDQSITTFSLDNTTNVLTLTLEDGGTQTVDFTTVLAAAGTDDQTATEVSVTDTAGNFTATDVEGALAELATGSTDDQALTLAAGNILTLEDGGTVDLTPFLDNTDDQTASEVDSDIPVDVDGDGTTEATVEDVIQDIAPIISKAARIFYPPSIAIDASTTGIKSIDLYQQYLDQFGTPTVSSAGAPSAVPTYGRTELYYYVTYADPAVFETDSGDPNFMTIDANGNLTIEVENLPADYNSLINIVFVVK